MLRRTIVVLLVICQILLALIPLPMAAHAQEAAGPVVDGVALQRSTVSGVELFVDPDVDREVIATASTAITLSLLAVPELTGLPQLSTPINAYILADDERFRLALAEIANVRTELVSEDIGGYTIERDGRMLIFFGASNLTSPASAIIGFSHELAHLAVREATQRRAVPQWFNEGYASWISTLALARHHPESAELQGYFDRMSVASALHTRGIIPWADLVTRTRFSRAGVEGLVNLAYGQSTLFIDFLAQRHGAPALARFLTAIGDGAGATQAFSGAFGPFGPEAAAYEAALATMQQETPRGLYLVQRPTADRAAIFIIVGAPALEMATAELLVDGELTRRRELEIDGAGMLVASFPPSLLDSPGKKVVRVTAPLLGALEIDPESGTRTLPTRGPVPAQPAPSAPAPAQIPARTGSGGRALPRAA